MATRPEDIFNTLAGGSSAAPSSVDQGATAPFALPAGQAPAPTSIDSYMREPEPTLTAPEERVIEKLKPDSELHRDTLDKLNAMWDFGKGKMKDHYPRWNYAEQRIQAWVSAQDYQRIMESVEKSTELVVPEPISVIVPYSYATLHAAATFIANVLLGRKPVFPLLATRGTEVDRARYMETALQSHIDASRGQETLWQFIWDPLIYGFGVAKNGWEERQGNTIRWIQGKRTMVSETTFAGNVTAAVDPYSFVPDPRVPIHQCNLRGDFMFCETLTSHSILKDMEAENVLKWVDEACKKAKGQKADDPGSENRRRLKIGIRGESLTTPEKVTDFYSIREGTVRLVPKDWKLGDSERSELWKFSWVKGQIIQAEPLGMIHNQHPMVATEPTSFGHDFMSVSMHDMIGPFQDILSWLVSSRMENVRTAINNQFVADPSRVEVNDIRTSAIGRIIRLKQQAMGLPVREAIMQLQVTDVTQGHISDIQTMRILADTITGVNDNMRGIQTAGGRRSATEARMSMQAGASRLSELAVRISAQGFLPLCQQMISNIQQFMPEKMWIETTGDDGQPSSQQMSAEMLVGSFNYQVSDGTLPYDKQALLEVWKEILFGIAKEPELRMEWSLPKIFRHVAELGGAKNIDSFKKQAVPQQQLGGQQMVAGAAADPSQMAGAVPFGPAMPSGPMM